MKLVIVTSVEEYHDDILDIFKKSNIENFSESEIDGYKNTPSILSTSNWFATNKSVTNSIMLFSFTEKEKIDTLFEHLEAYNKNIESNSPIKAIVLPIEKYL
jgi:hypothetical protein